LMMVDGLKMATPTGLEPAVPIQAVD